MIATDTSLSTRALHGEHDERVHGTPPVPERKAEHETEDEAAYETKHETKGNTGHDEERDTGRDTERSTGREPNEPNPGLADEGTAVVIPLALVPPPAPHEALSPFLKHADDGRLPEALIDDEARPGLVVDLLRDPAAVGRRILDEEALPRVVIVAALLVLVCGAFFAVVTMTPWASSDEVWRGSVMTPLSLLLALATALGPVWGVSVIMAARLPLARLAACMLTSVATAGLLLVAASPLPYAAWRADPTWGGPLTLFITFGLACLIAGRRLKALLLFCATATACGLESAEDARLDVEDAFRVGVLARMAMVALTFAGALSLWAFLPFG